MQPFGSADGAFREAAAGFGVVAEINAVGGGFEDDLMQSDDFAFAERSDFEFVRFPAGLADGLLYGDRGTGGRV